MNTPSNTKRSTKRSTKRAQFHHFDDTAKLLGLTHTALATKLGYADNSYHDWLLKRDMPYVAKLACDALLMQESKPLVRERVPAPAFVIDSPAGKVDAIGISLTAMGIPLYRLSEDSGVLLVYPSHDKISALTILLDAMSVPHLRVPYEHRRAPDGSLLHDSDDSQES